MKRRDLLAALALGAGSAEAQEPGKPSSLYIPKAHLVEDRTVLHDLMDEFAFADLVTASPAPRITHLPVMLDRTEGPYGTLRGHIARQNEQAKAFDSAQDAVIVFRGPNAYISPLWYHTAQAVPTWNFAAVHATGKLRAVADAKALLELLKRLTARFESYGGRYNLAKLPESYIEGLLARAVGFEMRIERLEGKFKLGQDRSEAEREEILQHLQDARPEPSLYDVTDSFYRRKA